MIEDLFPIISKHLVNSLAKAFVPALFDNANFFLVNRIYLVYNKCRRLLYVSHGIDCTAEILFRKEFLEKAMFKRRQML